MNKDQIREALEELYHMAEQREPVWLEGAARASYLKARQALEDGVSITSVERANGTEQ